MFEFHEDRVLQQFTYTLKDSKNLVLLSGTNYESKIESARALEAVILNGRDKNCYEIKTSKKGEKYFTLKSSSSGDVIGKSQLYRSELDLMNDMESIINIIVYGRLKITPKIVDHQQGLSVYKASTTSIDTRKPRKKQMA